MKFIFSLFFFIFIASCSKPKTVLICGDHICVNKAEADQYFEENLSIEIKIINNEIKNELDLVQLNLSEGSENDKKVKIFSKIRTDQDLKILSSKEKNDIKKKVKIKDKKKKLALKKVEKKVSNKKKEKKIFNEKINPNKMNNQKKTRKYRKDVVDVCTIIKKCSIEEISKYLINQGKKEKFPDITTRE